MSQSLPESLLHWAMDEMNYHPQGRHINAKRPSVEDFRDVCRGQSLDIWKFLVKNIYPAQTVKKVKGNLTLKSQLSSGYKVNYKTSDKYSHARSELIERRKQLSAELRNIQTSTQLVQRDIDRWQHSLQSAEQGADVLKASVHNVRRKTQLLNVYSQLTSDQIAVYQEYRNRLQSKVDSCTNTKSNVTETYFSKPVHGEHEKAIESASTRAVREACDVISNFLQTLLQGGFSTDKTLLEKHKDRLWNSVEKVLQGHPVKQVLSSLVLLTQDGAFNIREQTANISIAQDALKLRFKYSNNGQLTDLSESPSQVKSVHQLVEAEQMSHIERFMETEQNKNQAWKLHQELEHLKAEFFIKLERKYSGHAGTLELAKKCFEIQCQIAEAHSTVRVLQDVSSGFKKSIIQSAKEKEELTYKFKRIQDFQTLADSKQNLIRVLVKQNLSAKSKLESQQNQILHYLQSTVCAHEAETISMATQLKHSVTQEIDVFASMSLPHLMFTVLENTQKVAVIDLSINRLNDPVLSTGHDAIPQILAAMKFPWFKSPEHLLRLCTEMKHRVDELTDILAQQTADTASGTNSEYTVEKISKMCQEVAKHDEALLESVLPSLQARISRATNALSDCIQVKDVTSIWWDQPAQNTVPWVKVDNLTLQQWKDRWTVAVTRLRQLGH